MIYTVSFNPSLDYLMDVKSFKVGELNRSESEHILPGGKGVNVSIVLNNLGHKSKTLGFVAGFTGERLMEMLAQKHIDADFVKVKQGETRINVKVREEEETEINASGPDVSKDELAVFYDQIKALNAGDYLVLSGSIPKSVPKTAYMDIMASICEKDVNVVVDASGELLLKSLAYRPFLIKPNHHELGEMLGIKINDKKDVERYAAMLKDKGARNVLVSMAGDGAVLLDETGNVHSMSAPKGKVKNSVGAGDSMVAGFLAGYIESGSYENAFKMGICTGSASAFSQELATREEAEALLRLCE